jgi:hypothetical protein
MMTRAQIKELNELLGDPDKWNYIQLGRDTEGETIRIYKCPQCGATVWNVYQHKAWHFQAEI